MSIGRLPIIIKSFDKTLIGIYHPASTQSSTVPLAIICHGLGGDKCGRGRILVGLSDLLSKKGIASIRFDFFGSGDSEGAFSQLTPNICIQNLCDVVKAAQLGSFAPLLPSFGPIGLFGRSFGGYICILASQYITNIGAIAVQAPPFDAKAFCSLPRTFHEENGGLFFEGEPVAKEFLLQMQQLDMTDAVERLRTVPLLHISCENDVVITADHTQKFQKARDSSRAETCFESVAQADHSCSLYRHRTIVCEKVADWFVKFLKNF